MMTLPQIIFYIFAALSVLSALMVVTQNNPVRCVLFLVLTFFASAVLWLMQSAEFLALILILVYVGAVMTLFLFVVMMLNIDIEVKKSHLIRYMPIGLIVIALLVSLLIIALPQDVFNHEITSAVTQTSENASLSNTQQIGMVLYTVYILAFEVAAMLLLVAIVAAVTLSQRHLSGTKRQKIIKQLMTQSRDRVELVSMPAESLSKKRQNNQESSR